MSQSYFTVKGQIENLIEIQRSKFICNIKGISDEVEAKEFVESIRKKHSLATHNCYAYIADDKGLIQKFSDDGEPQGTAGLPMLEVLKAKKMFKTVAVVTRYYGGIKLGTGGLTRAYGGSVSECLGLSKVVNMLLAEFLDVTTDYDGYSILLKLLNNQNVAVNNTEFLNNIKVSLAVKKEYSQTFCDRLVDSFNGKFKMNK
jgi:uncharacterized YigZ family protein